MKRISFVLFLFVLLSCNVQKEPTQTPSEVLQLFFKNVALGNFEEAKQYATEKVSVALDQSAKNTTFRQYVKERAEIANKDNLLVIEREEINGDTAKVYLDMGPLSFEAPPVILVKVKGEWKMDTGLTK